MTAGPDSPRHPPRAGRRDAALAGVLATAAALGTGELVAALLPGGRSLVLAIADVVIANVPGWLERWAISTLGTADKPALVVGVVAVAGLFGAGLGVLARSRPVAAAAGMVAFAGLGVAAVAMGPIGSVATALLVAAIGSAVGVAALTMLVRAAGPPRDAGRPREATTPAAPHDDAATGPARTPAAPHDDATGPARTPAPASPDTAPEPADSPAPTGIGRRRFLGLATLAAAVAVVGTATARLLEAPRLDRVRDAVRLPRPATPAPPAPAGAALDVAGISPLYVPNAQFFRIDTALVVPQVDPDGWTLEVGGLVDEPFTLTFDELLDLPQVEADITLACVSNTVGGDLVGNARWQGVPLRDLLERAGVQDGATQLIGRSVDGFTAGFPIELAADAIVAVGMNGEPLPSEHGFPARLVVPGLYGYVSATKWLRAIDVTTFEAEVGFWIPRGWSREGPIKTQSRIDVPRGGTVAAGRQPVAGVAWAPSRGVERVEVRIDDRPWQEARLAPALGVDAWRQWVLDWDATPGEHSITVRATDGTGATQTAREAPPAPDGATGHHTVMVRVEG